MRAYLIDASPYIFRAYFAVPPSIQAEDGSPTNAVHGFASFLLKLFRMAEPTHVAVAFDESLTTSFRNDIDPAYKAQRALPPPELEAQQRWCREAAEALGTLCLVSHRYEADDLIASLVARLMPRGHECVVVTSDKDLAQLVGPRVSLWNFGRDERLDEAAVEKRFGVSPPARLLDVLSLAGDAVDNIPGVAGIGQKTAARLVREVGGLDEIYAVLDGSPADPRIPPGVRRKLLAGREAAYRSRRLTTLATDAPVPDDPEALRRRSPDRSTLEPLFAKLGLGGVARRALGAES